MKVQLKFKNKVYENYLIDENGVIYDLNGNIQETYQNQGRPIFKKVAVHRYVMHSFNGYREGMDIHHLNGDKFDNRLCNLVYLSSSEHISLHRSGKTSPMKGKPPWNKGQKMSEETTKRMSTARKGRICVNNGVINKMVYPNEIPEGFVRGVLRKV